MKDINHLIHGEFLCVALFVVISFLVELFTERNWKNLWTFFLFISGAYIGFTGICVIAIIVLDQQ